MGAFRRGLVVGFAAGYVNGAKAGRERYEQIMRLWGKVKATPAYQRTMDSVEEAIDAGLRRGKVMMLDGLGKATMRAKERARQPNVDGEVRSTFH